MISQSVIEGFVLLLGKDNVIDDIEYIELAEQTTYQTSQSIILTLLPANINQLKKCILIAQKNKISVYVVSQGKNWGYGSRVPIAHESVLIELKKINKILDYNEKYAYITVEPGVTFNQAFNFLREKQSELIISTTGGSGDASLIGNVLERGIGTGLYADRFNFICGLEVLLPNGEIINTGFESHINSQVGKLYRWGAGPYIDGLFSQSNLGIVIKMTIWLMKTPQFLSIAFYKISNENLSQVINKLQMLSMEGLLRPTFTIYNDTRIISSLMQFPFSQNDPKTTDSDFLMKQIRENNPALGNMVGDWNGEISFRSINQQQIDVQKQIIEEEFKEVVSDLTIITLSKEDVLLNFSQHYVATNKNLLQPTLRTFLLKKYTGIPDNAAIKQTYWRKRKPVPDDLNPDRDKCGMIWICPVIPFNGEDVLEVVNLIKKVLKKYHFEPAISFQCTSERCINVIGSFSWDREVKEEDETAVTCYFEINDLLFQSGYFNYRNTTLSLQKNSKSNYNFLSLLKKVVDPNNVLSPGRYISDIE